VTTLAACCQLQAELHILDAEELSQGPIATIRLPHHMPAAHHASWTPGGWQQLQNAAISSQALMTTPHAQLRHRLTNPRPLTSLLYQLFELPVV
jgi:hypothetical protein